MRDAVGTVRRSPSGLISVQTSWSESGENVRIIDPVTGTAGFQIEDYVAGWTILTTQAHMSDDGDVEYWDCPHGYTDYQPCPHCDPEAFAALNTP